MEDLHDFDIRREGRRWSREEMERKWRPHPEAAEDLPVHAGELGSGAASRERVKKLEALAAEVRKVVKSSGWRDRNLYWPEGMHLVEERLEELDRLGSDPRMER